jgi:hypothetical protein
MALGPPFGPPINYIPGGALQTIYVRYDQNPFLYTQTPVLTAALPAAATAGQGAKAWVSDATSRTWGAAPTGGGGDIVPVWCDGTTWYVGGCH